MKALGIILASTLGGSAILATLGFGILLAWPAEQMFSTLLFALGMVAAILSVMFALPLAIVSVVDYFVNRHYRLASQ